MNNKPQYKIYGDERRKLKKELSKLKYFIKYFWHHHQLDKDMSSFYGETENYPMSDQKAQKMYDDYIIKIKELENKLLTPYE